MKVRQLSIGGSWEFTPKQHSDSRGIFMEAFKSDVVESTIGRPFSLAQKNISISAAGVIRGIHYADIPPGQAKYITCISGAALDVVVDIRVGSPSFGQWEAVLLDDVDRRAVYVSEGLGHAFIALADGTTVSYLCSSGYDPAREHGIDPFDPAIGVEWPTCDRAGNSFPHIVSEKDRAAPTLAESRNADRLPEYSVVADYLSSLVP